MSERADSEEVSITAFLAFACVENFKNNGGDFERLEKDINEALNAVLELERDSK